MSQQYVAKTAILLSGKRFEPGTIVKVDEEELRSSLVRKGALVAVGSTDAIALTVRKDEPSTKVEKKPEDKKPRQGHHLFAFDPATLADKSLDDLNEMILARDPDVPPYDNEKEARAHLSKDFGKS